MSASASHMSPPPAVPYGSSRNASYDSVCCCCCDGADVVFAGALLFCCGGDAIVRGVGSGRPLGVAAPKKGRGCGRGLPVRGEATAGRGGDGDDAAAAEEESAAGGLLRRGLPHAAAAAAAAASAAHASCAACCAGGTADSADADAAALQMCGAEEPGAPLLGVHNAENADAPPPLPPPLLVRGM